MKKDKLIGKIDNLRNNGENSFIVSNNGEKFEFKLIEVNGDEYKVFGGFGYALRIFHKHWHSADIVNEFELALKGINKNLESCHFA